MSRPTDERTARARHPLGWTVWCALSVGALAVVMFMQARRHPDGVEALYSRGVYAPIARGLAKASAWVGFSLAEWSFLVAGVFVVLGFAVGVRRARRRDWNWAWSLVAGVIRAVARGLVVWTVFLFLWGLNYARTPVETAFDIGPPPKPAVAQQIVAELGVRLDALRGALPEDAHGVVVEPSNLPALDDSLSKLQAAVLTDAGMPAMDAGRVKRFVASPLFLRWGVSGMYGPFTGEPNLVWPSAPGLLPFTLAHERAHLSGFAWEEAASFVGLLTCWRSPDPAVRYSGMLALWMELGSGTKGRHPGVVRDLTAISEFGRKYRGSEAPTLWKAYSGYLSAHGVKGGTQSYRRVAALALAYCAKHDLPPEPPHPPTAPAR